MTFLLGSLRHHASPPTFSLCSMHIHVAPPTFPHGLVQSQCYFSYILTIWHNVGVCLSYAFFVHCGFAHVIVQRLS